MGCCGQKRDGMRNPPPPSTSHASPIAKTPRIDRRGASGAATPPLGGRVLAVRYVERSRLVVRGPATGRQYQFSLDKPMQMVSVQDADALLRTRYFVRG